MAAGHGLHPQLAQPFFQMTHQPSQYTTAQKGHAAIQHQQQTPLDLQNLAETATVSATVPQSMPNPSAEPDADEPGDTSPTTITDEDLDPGEGTGDGSPAPHDEEASPSPSGSLSNVGGRRSSRVRHPTLKSLEV